MTVYKPEAASWSWDITVLIAEYLLKLSVTENRSSACSILQHRTQIYNYNNPIRCCIGSLKNLDNNASWIEEQEPVLHRHIFLNICLSEFPQIPLKHMLIQNISYKKRHKPNYICYSINRIIWKFQTITGLQAKYYLDTIDINKYAIFEDQFIFNCISR